MALENNKIEKSNLDNDEISLKELIINIKEWFIFLISKWKIIFITGFIGGVIGITFALFEKPAYKAILTFAMEEDKGSGGGLSGALGLASSFGIDLGGSGGGAFAASNLTELMKSRLLVEKVLLKPIVINGKIISLAEYYIQLNDLRKSWEEKPALKSINFLPNSNRSNFTRQQDSILKKIHKSLIDPKKLSILQKDKKVTILSIEVTSEDEVFSKIFCENIAKETSEFYIESKSKKAKLNVSILQRQVDSIRNSLDFAISGAASELDNVYNLNPAFNIKGAPSRKKQIDITSNTAIFSNLVVQLELAKIALRKETPLIQVIDQPILPLQMEKFGKTKFSIIGGFIAGLLAIFYFIFSRLFKNIMNE